MSYEPTVRFSSIWVEEMLTRCTFNASSWGRSHFRRRKVEPTTLTANRRGRQRFVHLEVLIEADGQDDSLVVAKVASTTQRQNPNKRSLEVRLGHLGILVHNSLAWRFDRNNRTTLSRHESIDIEGGTLRLVLAQPSIMGTLHLDLWWTPKRNLLVVKFVAFKLPREPFQVRVEHKTLSRPPAIGRLPMQNFEFGKRPWVLQFGPRVIVYVSSNRGIERLILFASASGDQRANSRDAQCFVFVLDVPAEYSIHATGPGDVSSGGGWMFHWGLLCGHARVGSIARQLPGVSTP